MNARERAGWSQVYAGARLIGVLAVLSVLPSTLIAEAIYADEGAMISLPFFWSGGAAIATALGGTWVAWRSESSTRLGIAMLALCLAQSAMFLIFTFLFAGGGLAGAFLFAALCSGPSVASGTLGSLLGASIARFRPGA